ncbi:class I SAM-dependent methyltransferase [Chloroflexota bacterium]
MKRYFKKDQQIHFDFSQAPALIKRKGKNALETIAFGRDDTSRWAKAQNSFLRWTSDQRAFTEQYIERGKKTYGTFFEKRGPLRGKIIDIGGGWGLYRQWWEPGESDIFIVHDPGVQRFLHGPHRLHQYYYQKAFSLPMTFVEGFGEDLPYESNIFDTCLIAVTLDHCINPQKVCSEAYHVLRPGGSILVIQSCNSPTLDSYHRHILKRLLQYLRHPKSILVTLSNLLFYPDRHLHHFSTMDIISLLEQSGFSKINVNIVPTTKNVYGFEAIKEHPDIS